MEWVIWAAIALVGILLVYALLDRVTSPPQQAVLPSHYDPTNYYADPSSIPGWCVHCETRNDPDFRYCENCAAELPDAERAPSAEHFRPFGGE